MKPSKKKGIAVIVFLLLLLVGCAKDTEAPVITDVLKEGNTITIEASDNQKIKGYILTSEMTTPNAKDADAWQVSNVFSNVVDGTYYVWVKDGAGNISKYSDQVFVAHEYAKNFDMINWLKAPVDQDLKQKYGDLYRMVEPLTKEEIEKRFEFLVWFSEEQLKNPFSTVYSSNSGLYCTLECDDIYNPKWYEYSEKMDTSNDPVLSKFGKYFGYSKVVGKHAFYLPSSFDSSEGIFGISQENKNSISLEDKEVFVRFIAWAADTELEAIKELGLEVKYYFEDPNFTYDNEFSYTK